MKTGTKRLSAIAVACTTALALGGCTSGHSSTKDSGGGAGTAHKSGQITIAYLQKQGVQKYFVDEAAGAKAEAAKLGVQITVVNVSNNSSRAVNALTAQVDAKVDGIAIVTPDQKIGPQLVRRAGTIPIVASDDPIKDSSGHAVPFVGFDSKQLGTSVGTKAGELFKAARWSAAETRVLAAYSPGLSDCRDRESGEEAGFAKAAGARVQVIKLSTDNSDFTARIEAAKAIAKNPHVKHWIAWGCNDESETGVVATLQSHRVGAADIIGVGLGAYLTCKDWAADKPTGNKAALFLDARAVGKAAVDALVNKIRKGVALRPNVLSAGPIVDAASYKQHGVPCA